MSDRFVGGFMSKNKQGKNERKLETREETKKEKQAKKKKGKNARRKVTSPTGQRCVRTVSLRVLTLALSIYVTYMEVQMDRQMKQQSSNGGSQSTVVDHLIQYRISPWPKTSGKFGFCTGVTDTRDDGRTN